MRQEVGESGEVSTAYRFDPYGTPLQGSGGNPFGYTGEQWDGQTQLLYLRARYYSPQQGRFVSKDPFPGFVDRPQSLNGWTYAEGNPIRYADPSGLIRPPETFMEATIGYLEWQEADDIRRELAEKYHVFIPRDYGYREIYVPPYPGLPSEIPSGRRAVWDPGAWEINELRLVRQAVMDMAEAMGGECFFKKAMGNVSIMRLKSGLRPFSPPAFGRPLNPVEILFPADVVLTDEHFRRAERLGVRYWTVHELAHVWDTRMNLSLSSRLPDEIGTTWNPYTGYNVDAGIEPAPGDVYEKEDRSLGIPYAGTNSLEDWAESFASYVYSDYYTKMGRRPLEVYRRRYVQTQLRYLWGN